MTKNSVYVVGRFYRVPVSRGLWCGVLADWVVMTPWHNDAEIIKFPDYHYHLDPRFLCRRAFDQEYVGSVHPVFSTPLKAESDGSTLRTPSTPVLRLRKCLRTLPAYPRTLPTWLPKLAKAFAGQTAVRRCPHKGGDLTYVPVIKGCKTCPLHGLLIRGGVVVDDFTP